MQTIVYRLLMFNNGGTALTCAEDEPECDECPTPTSLSRECFEYETHI